MYHKVCAWRDRVWDRSV